ncbi:MAG: hypothetical protein RR396_06835 [Clostridiales bacterium]
MEIIVHYPSQPERQKALSKQVATVHAQAIHRYLNKLSCPKEQQLLLIKLITQSLTEKS